ncbi:MAG: YceI family protein [Flavobacteriales bacterium]|nr:YceI family protein [Flavobacteriales bacterium]
MKTIKFLAAGIIASSFFLASCAGSGSEKPANADSTATGALADGRYTINPALSKVTWKAEMFKVKEHFGTIGIKEGVFEVRDGKLASGNVVVDMKSMAPQDTNYTAEGDGSKGKLIGHLQSADFFNVELFPTSTFSITSVEGSTAKGTLTLRDKTDAEQVENMVLNATPSGVTASGSLTFDRQKYGAAFTTGSPDFVISDDVMLTFELVADR